MAVTLDPRLSLSSRPRTHRGTLAVLSGVFLLGVVFIVQAALPYFALNEAQFQSYWPRRWGLLVHITTGIVALLSGPVQLWLGLTDRRPDLHRRFGLVYVLAVVLSAAAGYYLAFTTAFGVVFGAGLAGLATAWLVTTGLAYVAIRRQAYDQHKEWMIRSYVVTTAFVTFRAAFAALQGSAIGENAAAALLAWACWAIPLLITEAVLQGRKIHAVRAT
jgi:hypothetical protein